MDLGFGQTNTFDSKYMFQASSVSRRLWNTSEALSSFMNEHVGPSCDTRGIPRPISQDLFQALATDKTMRFVHALTNSPSQMRDLITATPKIRDIPLRLYRNSMLYAVVTNRQTEMSEREGRLVTRAEAHTSLGHDGIRAAVTNRQTAMIAQEVRQVTRSEAHTSLGHDGGNRRVETQHEYSNRLKRFPKTMSEAGRISGNARAIDDDRVLCRTAGCQNRQLTASNPLCKTCYTKKNKRKREEDEKSGARICAECKKEIIGRMTKGFCDRCYQRQLRKTGRVIDPATKLCTHASGCQNKRYRGGLCKRHYKKRHLEASADTECAASASAATAPKKMRPKKARNGKKKAKKKKPVVINENRKTEGLTNVHYEDEEVEVDSDDDDDEEWDEEY